MCHGGSAHFEMHKFDLQICLKCDNSHQFAMIFSGVYIDYIDVFDIDAFGCRFFWSPQVTRFVHEFDILWPMHLRSWHFTESVLQTCFFCEALPPNLHWLHCFHKLHPVTRGTCYCQYKILCCVLGVQPCFSGCPCQSVTIPLSMLSFSSAWRR